MVVPPKGDVSSIGGGMGVLNPAGTAIANAWDPAKDEAEGNQCKGYGAGAISRIPTRAHVTWQDANTMKWETDQGMQTRLFTFGAAAQASESNPGPRSWQGVSVATWEPVAGGDEVVVSADLDQVQDSRVGQELEGQYPAVVLLRTLPRCGAAARRCSTRRCTR